MSSPSNDLWKFGDKAGDALKEFGKSAQTGSSNCRKVYLGKDFPCTCEKCLKAIEKRKAREKAKRKKK